MLSPSLVSTHTADHRHPAAVGPHPACFWKVGSRSDSTALATTVLAYSTWASTSVDPSALKLVGDVLVQLPTARSSGFQGERRPCSGKPMEGTGRGHDEENAAGPSATKLARCLQDVGIDSCVSIHVHNVAKEIVRHPGELTIYPGRLISVEFRYQQHLRRHIVVLRCW